MTRNLPDLTKAAIFYVIAITFSILVVTSSLSETPKVVLNMFTPLLAVLVMMLVVTKEGYSHQGWSGLGLGRLGLKVWPFAILVPFAVVATCYLIIWSTGLASIDRSQSLFLSIADMVIVLVIATLTLSLGEELGWRGYLLPRLVGLGRGRAMLISGVLHAFFHFPLILFTSYYLADGNKLFTLPLFVITMTSAGFLYGYLRFTTDSVWPASVAHSAHNAITETLSSLTIASPLTAAYWLGEGGILIPIGYTLCAVWVVVVYLRRPAKQTGEVPPATGADDMPLAPVT